MIVIIDRRTNKVSTTTHKAKAAQIIGVTPQTICNWSKHKIFMYGQFEIHFDGTHYEWGEKPR